MKEDEDNEDIMKTKVVIKAPRWGYAFFRSSIYFHSNLTFLIDFILGMALLITFGRSIYEQSGMENTFSKFQSLIYRGNIG